MFEPTQKQFSKQQQAMMKPVYNLFNATRSAVLLSTFITCAFSSLSHGEGMVTDSGLEIKPKMTATYGYDGNVLGSSDDEKSSSFSSLVPEVSLLVDRRRSKFSLKYKLQKVNYFSSPADNFLDHYLIGDSQYRFGIRHKLDLGLYYANGHDKRGAGASSGVPLTIIDEPVEYRDFSVTPKYTFGAKNAKANVSTWFSFYNRRHQNFENLDEPYFDSSTRFDNVDVKTLAGEFSLKLKPRLNWVTRYEIRDSAYQADNPNLPTQDNFTQELYTGLKWNLSGKTDGFARVGYQKKDFDDGARENFNGLNYSLAVNWRPRPFSTFSVSSSYLTRDPQRNGDYTEERSAALSWQHDWSRNIYTLVRGSYVDQETIGAASGFDREKRVNMGLELGYKVSEYFQLSIRYQDSEISR